MRKIIQISTAGLIWLLASCQSSHEKLSKLWLYTHYSGSADDKKNSFSPTSFLLLQSNGSFTKDFGVFESGRWELKQDQLFLFNDHRLLASYRINFDEHDLRLTTEHKELVNFESALLNNMEETENPFSLHNNQWRIKAAHKETDDQLIARLLNHLQYWEAYFTWAYNNHLQMIDVRSPPTPIKIYGNGFVLKELSALPRTWINLFYDEPDCVRANTILEETIKNTTIAWSHTTDKYKMFIGAFQQLHDNLKK